MNEFYYNVNDVISAERNKVLEKIYSRETEEGINYKFWDLSIYQSSSSKGLRESVNAEMYLRSHLESSITLTSEQFTCLTKMTNNNLLLSAPTSFGKTFIVLEYMKRNKDNLKNIVFVVPTIALMNELVIKFNKYFSDYNLVMSPSEKTTEKNIFVMVAERNGIEFTNLLKEKQIEIDLFVIDEFYKLSRKEAGIRVISMNNSYFKIAPISKKCVFLTPFTKNVLFERELIELTKYVTNYTPVINNVEKKYSSSWSELLVGEQNLIYYESPDNILEQYDLVMDFEFKASANIEKIIEWMKEEVYIKWDYIDFLEHGFGIHHGHTPIYLRKFFELEFNSGNLNGLFCTSTLAEGVNTKTDNLIVAQAPTSSFKLNNIIGRAGRLNVSNPMKANIFLTDKACEDLYKPNTWEEIKIVAEDTREVKEHDEVIYLEKQNKKLEDELKIEIAKFCNMLKIEENELKQQDYEFKVIKKINQQFYKDNYTPLEARQLLRETFNSCTKPSDYLNIAMKCIPYKYSFTFTKEKLLLETSGEKSSKFIAYKKYIWNILFEKKVCVAVDDYIEINKKATTKSINKFIDAYFSLENYTKYNLVKIPMYFDFFENILGDDYAGVESFTDHIKKYSTGATKFESICKDLGVYSADIKEIMKVVKYFEVVPESISTSDTIRLLKKYYHVFVNQISEISKQNIKAYLND